MPFCAESFVFQFTMKDQIYRTTTLTVVPYGCETWSVTLTVDRRLTVFENRALRKLFGPKRDEVTGQWIRLHNKELYACTPLQVLFG